MNNFIWFLYIEPRNRIYSIIFKIFKYDISPSFNPNQDTFRYLYSETNRLNHSYNANFSCQTENIYQNAALKNQH